MEFPEEHDRQDGAPEQANHRGIHGYLSGMQDHPRALYATLGIVLVASIALGFWGSTQYQEYKKNMVIEAARSNAEDKLKEALSNTEGKTGAGALLESDALNVSVLVVTNEDGTYSIFTKEGEMYIVNSQEEVNAITSKYRRQRAATSSPEPEEVWRDDVTVGDYTTDSPDELSIDQVHALADASRLDYLYEETNVPAKLVLRSIEWLNEQYGEDVVADSLILRTRNTSSKNYYRPNPSVEAGDVFSVLFKDISGSISEERDGTTVEVLVLENGTVADDSYFAALTPRGCRNKPAQREKDLCIRDTAVGTQNEALCMAIKTDELVGDCYVEIGIAKEDSALCNHVSGSHEERCLLGVAQNTNDPLLCDLFEEYDDEHITCYSSMATHFKDSSYCAEIENTVFNYEEIGQCYGSVAVELNTPALCDSLTEDEVREACVELAQPQEQQTQTQPYDYDDDGGSGF